MTAHRSRAIFLRFAIMAIGLLVIGSAEFATAATIYVNNHYGNDYPGTGARRDPYHTIQLGIDASAVGDTVMVANGTYHERITLKSAVALKGAGADVTTIDGDASGSVVTAIDVDANTSMTGFTITNGTGTWDEYGEWVNGGGMYCKNSELTVSGCVLYKNIAYTDPDYDQGQGGGIFCADSSLTIINTVFEENVAGELGGGFCGDNAKIMDCLFKGNQVFIRGSLGGGAGGSSLTIINSRFIENYSDKAGGLYVGGASTIQHSQFINNRAEYCGGLSTAGYGAILINGCRILGNKAISGPGWGGGACLSGDAATMLTNSIVQGNEAAGWFGEGGGIYIEGSPTITNCTITNNCASGEEYMKSTGGGIWSYSDDVAPTISNCIIWRNRPNQIRHYRSSPPAVVRYSNVQLKSGTYRGPGNINRRPRFVDFNGADNVIGTADDNLHLRPGSPGIDAGDNHALGVMAVDLDGNLRRVNDPQTVDTGLGRRPDIDMGAYEFQVR